MAASPRVTTAGPVDRRSFVDRLIDAIDRLPMGGWWAYPLVTLFAAAWVTVARWVTGIAPVGQLDLSALAFLPYGPFSFALIHYLDKVAARSVDAFAPALGGPPEELAAWRRRLTRLPSGPTAAATVLGLAFGATVVVGSPPAIDRLFGSDIPIRIIVVGWIVVLSFAINFVLLYHTWHQLRAVAAIHAAAKRIDPFQTVPLFTFSRLTARTGLGYLVILYYSVTFNAELSTTEISTLGVSVLFAIAGLACFVLPLIGMHGRLVEAKDDLVAQAEARMIVVRDELYRRVDDAQLTKMSELSDGLTGLASVREVAHRVPTWPWSPGLFRGFVTALLLPIGIWLITRIIGSVLPV